jgi:hypothetical protein
MDRRRTTVQPDAPQVIRDAPGADAASGPPTATRPDGPEVDAPPPALVDLRDESSTSDTVDLTVSAPAHSTTIATPRKGAVPEPDADSDDVFAGPGTPTAGSISTDADRESRREEIDARPDALLVASNRLRSAVAATGLRLELPEVGRARKEMDGLLDQFDDYLLPRLRRMDAPLLAVIGGSTGAGKSTLTNSLVGRVVSRSGVLRPTTRSPVLVHHPFDAGAFLTQRILPGLARVTSEAPEPLAPLDIEEQGHTSLRLVPHEGIAPGLAVVDAPDIDSVVEANRDLAAQLLSAADLWIFVTTAARYADAVPWEMLRQAVERGIAVAIVLDRVPPEAVRDIRVHLATMLRDRGLARSPMFTIPETQTVDGLLPQGLVAPLLAWLKRLARDARSRQIVVNRTLVGALDSLPERIQRLAEAADAQVVADERLRQQLAQAYEAARRDIVRHLGDGTLLRGEVLARWQEFVGTGEFIRALEAKVGKARDRITAALSGRQPPVAEPLGEALQTGIHALVTARVDEAIDQAVMLWRSHPAGAALVEAHPDVTAVSGDFDRRLRRVIRDWQLGVLDLVRTEGEGRRTTARVLSLGVNGTGVVLMLVAFSHTGGALLGAEAGIAAGTAVVAQRLLEAIFGDQAVRSLASHARDDLLSRLDKLLEAERRRMVKVLDAAAVSRDRGPALRSAVRAVEEAR